MTTPQESRAFFAPSITMRKTRHDAEREIAPRAF
jgi:hypothetical protein